MEKFKKRGCCGKCKLFKDGECKDGHNPVQRGSTIYQCGHQKKYAKDVQKTTRKQKKDLSKILDQVFGDYIRYRDNGICITCLGIFNPGDRMGFHWGHYITKSNKESIRWEKKNVYGQCSSCNCKQNTDGNSYMLSCLLKLGLLTLEENESLFIKSKRLANNSDTDIQDMIDKYNEKLLTEKERYSCLTDSELMYRRNVMKTKLGAIGGIFLKNRSKYELM
jgi:hypothetical protein